MLIFKRRTDPVEGLERIMDEYFRRDPILEATASISQYQAEMTQWVESSAAKLQSLGIRVSSLMSELRAVRTEIEEIDQRLTRASQAAQDSLDSTRHLLVEKHNRLAACFSQNQQDYNQRVQAHNRECERRQSALQEMHSAALTRCDKFNSWLESGGRDAFAAELNGLYASLVRTTREQKQKGPELDSRIRRTRALRKNLAEHAIAQEEARANGMLIVAAIVGDEEVFLTVDTGSNLVTITPEIVDALGWNHRIGRETEVALAAGIRVRCREIRLPSIQVQGFTAQEVDAVVLKETQPGVDGVLGLSFLNRFNYQIVRQHPRRLGLTVLQQGAWE